MKILYIPSQSLGVIFWRIESYAQELVKFADRCTVHVDYFGVNPWEHSYSWDSVCMGHGKMSQIIQERIKEAFNFFDIIVFQKIQNKNALTIIETLKKKYPKTKLIAELDDSVGDINPSNIYSDRIKNEHTYAAQHLQLSDAAICSTEYLKKQVAMIVPETPVYVAPNCVNYDLWQFKEADQLKKKKKRLGYVGALGHDEDLKIAYRAVMDLYKQKKMQNWEFVIRYGGFLPDWLKPVDGFIDFEPVSVHISEYPQFLYDLDIDLALAPLRDTNFNRCKSNLKWLEWSSMGVPLVGSDVEPFMETNGSLWLSNNDQERFSDVLDFALYTLSNENNVEKLKKDLLKENRENYNINKECDKLLTFFESMLK